MKRLLCLAAVVLAAACSPTTVATPATTAAPTVAPADPTPPADGGPGTAAPPVVTLTVPGLGDIAGELGSYTWGGSGSDSPWIAAKTGPRVLADTELAIAVADITADHWTAAWAPVSDGRAGNPVSSATGEDGAPIRVTAPSVQGPWSLRIEAWFGNQWHAAWYWRLEVQP